MSDNKLQQAIELLSSLTILEVNELVKELEDKWGVSAQAAPVAMAPAAGGEAAAAEKANFDVKLTAVDTAGKIKVIKEVKETLGLGLVDAKKIVDSVPSVVKADMPKADAEALKAKLEAVGATVELE